MPTVVNNNLKMIDLPIWEQLTAAPANSAAGSCIDDDGERFIYYLLAATNFWRYDTWSNTWQQLANLPAGTVGIGTSMRFTKLVGGQHGGQVHGTIIAIIASSAAPVHYWYDIATNTWSAAKSVAGLPATVGTNAAFVIISPMQNNYERANFSGNHSGAMKTITSSGAALSGDTTLNVSALPIALLSGAILNFGTSASPLWVVLTAAASQGATSLTVAPLLSDVGSGLSAYYYNEIYWTGNASTQVYRYSLSTNTWATTSQNSGNPAIPVMPLAVGAACEIRWVPAFDVNGLYVIRGGATSTIYRYGLDTNTWTTVTIKPETETFTTGTSYGVRTIGGKNAKILISKEATNRIYELNLSTLRINPIASQFLFAQGAALIGDRSCVMRSPEGIEFFYMILNTSSIFVRTPLFF